MSVLVEALSVVVRRATLDLDYPGGTDAYLQAATAKDCVRLACADDELTSVSFLDADAASAWVGELADFNIYELSEGSAFEVVCVDQNFGTTLPCDWIDWRKHPDGYTYCWLTGSEPGDVAVPADWTIDQSRRLNRKDVNEQGHQMVPLAVEDGVEYWLDLNTGRQIAGLPQAAPSAPPSTEPDSLMPAVRAAMEHLEWTPDVTHDDSFRVRLNGKRFNFAVWLIVDEEARTFVCYGILPINVEPARRVAVAETMTRINFRLRLGTFDLDFDDGEMRYRTGCDVEGGELTQHMVLTVVGNVCASIDRYGSALMRVMFGDATPEDAAAEILSGN